MDWLSGVTSSVLGSLGGSALDAVGSWFQNSSKESLNKNITKTNLKYQKEYDVWTQAQDKAYEQWFQDYIYSLQNNQYYNLAKKYAQNSASWAVQGLKKAGLNPILAGIDSNLSSTTGNAQPQSSGHRTGGGSVRGASVSGGYKGSNINLSASMQQLASAKQSEVQTDISQQTKDYVISKAKSDADIAAKTGPQISANTAKTIAEADYIAAQAQKTRVDTVNAERNSGSPSIPGAVFRVTRELGDVMDKYSPLSSLIKAVREKVSHDSLESDNTRRGLSTEPHSAKESSQREQFRPRPQEPEIKWLPKERERMERQVDEYFKSRRRRSGSLLRTH